MSTDDVPLDLSAPRPLWRRPWLWAVLAATVAGSVLALRGGGGEEGARYVTARVDRGDVVARVTASGTLSALVQVEVGSQVSGRIQSLHADFNSEVKQGQLIAKIDPALFDAAVAQASANVAAAKGNLARAQVQAADARRQARRAQELQAQGLLSAGERDTTRANADGADAAVLQAQGQLAQAEAQLGQAQTNLRYTDIVAPTDGVVISRAVNVGQTVAASLQAPVLFTIAQDLRQMQIDTNVAEADVGKLAPDMPVTFTVDAWPGEPFEGRIRQIRNAAQVVQNVVTYDAVINVANPDLKLKPGMTSTVTFVHARRENVLRVPNAALRFRPPSELTGGREDGAGRGGVGGAGGGGGGGRRDGAGDASATAGAANRDTGARAAAAARTLWVLRDGAPAAVSVRLGVSDGAMTELVEGDLREGDEVITDMPGAGSQRRQAPFRIL